MKTKTHIIPAGHRKLTDEELTHRYAHRQDLYAAYTLFERYGHLIYGLCCNWLAPGTAPETAFRHVFIRILDDIRTRDIPSFKTWLYLRVKFYTQGYPEVPAEEESDPRHIHISDSQPGSGRDVKDLSEALNLFLREQDQTGVADFRMFYIERMTYSAIAAATGRPEAAIRKNIRKTLEGLVRQMTAAEKNEPGI